MVALIYYILLPTRALQKIFQCNVISKVFSKNLPSEIPLHGISFSGGLLVARIPYMYKLEVNT